MTLQRKQGHSFAIAIQKSYIWVNSNIIVLTIVIAVGETQTICVYVSLWHQAPTILRAYNQSCSISGQTKRSYGKNRLPQCLKSAQILYVLRWLITDNSEYFFEYADGTSNESPGTRLLADMNQDDANEDEGAITRTSGNILPPISPRTSSDEADDESLAPPSATGNRSSQGYKYQPMDSPEGSMS